MTDSTVTLEVFGDGKTEIGSASDEPQPPDGGVVSILVHKLCGSPDNMLVKRKSHPFLRELRGKRWAKVRFAMNQY